MALNWFLTLRNLAKTDETAKELFEQLQKAETDEEKDIAKANAKAYVEEKSKDNTPQPEEAPAEIEPVVETETVDEGVDNLDSDGDTVLDSELQPEKDTEENPERREEVQVNMADLSQLAFNPRLAKCGVTREEELFLNHVFVRKLSHEDKILMRRSIYQKKTQRNAQIQAEYKAKRLAQKQKDLNDPEKIKFHQERKMFAAVLDALENHKNLGWIFSNIEDLTTDIMREFLKNPGNVNALNKANPNFISNFKKKYGK